MHAKALQSTWRPKGLATVALGLLFIGLGINTVQRAAFMSVERSDFPVYQAAGRALLDGTPLYEAQSARGWLYMYLPVFALLMVPLAVLPKAVAVAIWYLVSLGMLLHMAWTSARLAERYLGPSQWEVFWTFVGALVLTGWPWMSGLARGQASVMLSWLTIVAIDCFVREETRRPGRRWYGASTLALASAIRVFPALLGIWLLIGRKWRALVGCLVAGVALVIVVPGLVLGPARNMELIYEWVTRIALPAGQVAQEEDARYAQMIDPRILKNQSMQAVSIRLIAPARQAPDDGREKLARGVAAAVGAGLLGVTIVAAWASRRRGQSERAALTAAGAFVMLMLFVPPVSWAHNYSMAILPVAILLVRSFPAGGAVRRWHAGALCAWIVCASSSLLTVIYWAGGFLIGGLVLWGALVADLMFHSRRRTGGDTVDT